MTLFDAAFEDLMKHEGGYANVAGDAGGMTFRGISKRSFPNWEGWPKVLNAYYKYDGLKRSIDKHFENDTKMYKMVKNFYETEFWNKVSDKLLPRLRNKVFNTCVNIGLIPGLKFLQRAVSAKEDGIIGPKTIKSMEIFTEDFILEKYCNILVDYYNQIVKNKPKNEKFLKSWLKRAAWIPASYVEVK